MLTGERALQLRWIIHCLDDIASDMSVFHRVDDITTLDGPTLCRLAWRLARYEGAVRARLLEEQQQQEAHQPREFGPAGSTHGGERQWNPGTAETLKADPALKGIISFD
jgi:hypothetical protein